MDLSEADENPLSLEEIREQVDTFMFGVIIKINHFLQESNSIEINQFHFRERRVNYSIWTFFCPYIYSTVLSHTHYKTYS